MEKNDTPNVGKKNIMEVLARTSAAQLPAIPEVAARFKELFQVFNGRSKMAAAFYEAEKFHFMKTINESESLKQCSKLSLYGCFLDVAVSGLSFDPSHKHLYLVPFKTNIGTRQKPVWEPRAQLQISGYGELVLRIRQGQIKYVDNPVLVYEDEIDTFSYGTKNGSSFVDHVSKLSKIKDRLIVACYIKITRTDGTVDYKVLTQDDMDRFKAYAKKDSSGNLSKAWTDGIGGMWQSKCIKHAFKNYPKVKRMGPNTALATEIEDTEAEVVNDNNQNIDYDLIETHGATVSDEIEQAGESKVGAEEKSSAEDGGDFMEDDKKEKKAPGSGGTVHIQTEEHDDFS